MTNMENPSDFLAKMEMLYRFLTPEDQSRISVALRKKPEMLRPILETAHGNTQYGAHRAEIGLVIEAYDALSEK